MSTLPSEMIYMVFTIVDNMNRGSKLIDEPGQKYELAQLNLKAGKQALGASAFHSATKYLLTGLSLLGADSWDIKYDLTIQLYNAGTLWRATSFRSCLTAIVN